MKKPDMRALGAKGGKVRSTAKIAACKANIRKAREAAALKRANRLPNFDDGVPASSAFPPAAEAERAGARDKGLTDGRGSRPSLDKPTLEDLGITKSQSSDWQRLADIPEEKSEEAKPMPVLNSQPTNGKRWPPWPDPVLRTPYQIAVRMSHKTFNPHCVCGFCVP
jgi:hypothetical protein